MTALGMLLVVLLFSPLPAYAAVTYTAIFPTEQRAMDPATRWCDVLNCELVITVPFSFATLPRFDPAAGTLESIVFTYDVFLTATSTGYNHTDADVFSWANLEPAVRLQGPPITTNARVCAFPSTCPQQPSTLVAPGAAVVLATWTAEAMGTLTFLPGDPGFSEFVGPGTLGFIISGDAFQRANVSGCDGFCYVDPTTAPILLSAVLGGTLGVTYIDSPATVPLPPTFWLLLVGVVLLAALLSSLRTRV